MAATSGYSQSGQPLGRGGPRGQVEPSQNRPSQHADHQYEGFFRGLGATSKEPICSKKSSSLKRLHDATHFAVGCQKWDGGRGPSTTHTAFTDPEVVYATCDAPDKNTSIVELRQCHFDANVHYRTEQRERFEDPGPQPPNQMCKSLKTQVFLGDDKPVLQTQSHASHRRLEEEESSYSKALRAAGSGVVLPTGVWPKPVRCNPITGGPRNLDIRDVCEANGVQFPRITQNSSTIMMEANVRNPIFGHHTPLTEYRRPVKGNMRTTMDITQDVSKDVPPLRSLGALRPH
eukprot:TRINITY_DN96496_c0_g1_i2.p1 TRINITY_DN96496_c0_g1~~TRINITY_DN96496_c0_g1_i2.p1  ORF type:complete len:299 (-),score=43.33 TRINITY_DN96496_c0_g1_i2:69-935(-)